MSKLKTVYICQACGARHEKMQGQCKNCKEWNTLAEEVIETSIEKKAKTSLTLGGFSSKAPKTFENVQAQDNERIITPDAEFNRVTGGGIVLGSVILIGGEPGIGKSTLLLQLSL